MSNVKVHSKQPPGGRCSLYMRYAETLHKKLGLAFEVHYCEDGAEVPPPAMLIGETLVAPTDGVIVSPEDIAYSLRGRLPEAEVSELARLLEATQEQWMAEWSGN